MAATGADLNKRHFCGSCRQNPQRMSKFFKVCSVSKGFPVAYAGGRPLGGYCAVDVVDAE